MVSRLSLPGLIEPAHRALYSAEARALFLAMTTAPSRQRKRLIDQTVRGLVSTGLWAKLDALWVMAAHDAQAARLNWVAPATYTLTDVGSPTFAADSGFTGNGSSSALSTGYNPGGGGSPRFTRDDASLFGWSRTAGQTSAFDANKSMMGVGGGTSEAFIFPRDTSDVFRARINTTSSIALLNPVGNSLYVSSRTGSSASAVYQYAENGSFQTNTSTAASAAVKNATWRLLGTDGGYWPGKMAIAGAGSSMTRADANNLFALLRRYLAAIGAVT